MTTTPTSVSGDPTVKTFGAGVATTLIALSMMLLGIGIPKIADNDTSAGAIIVTVLGALALAGGFVVWHLRETRAKGELVTAEQRGQMLSEFDLIVKNIKDPTVSQLLMAHREAFVDGVIKSGHKLGEAVAAEIDKSKEKQA